MKPKKETVIQRTAMSLAVQHAFQPVGSIYHVAWWVLFAIRRMDKELKMAQPMKETLT